MLLFSMLSSLGAWAASSPPNRNLSVLDLASWDSWRSKIETDEDERSFLRIPWRISFLTAMQDAQRLDQPVMLFVMNGHPLGCT